MKTKTYVLILSKTFPKGHPREGERTHFVFKTIRKMKLHTIRRNYDFWKERIDEVNAGNAVLSVRQWTGKPYRSKQEELFRLDKDSGIGVEEVWLGDALCHIHGEKYDAVLYREIAKNDGLTLEDWLAWFRKYDRKKPLAIIHFTSFRYCK